MSIQAASEDAELTTISFWKPNITISIVDEFKTYSPSSLPQQLKQRNGQKVFFVLFIYFLSLDYRFFRDGQSYFPIVHYNDFWLLYENLMPINNTVSKFISFYSFLVSFFLKFEFWWKILLLIIKYKENSLFFFFCF